MSDVFDTPWKDVLGDGTGTGLFPELMGFFFPDVAAEIDWSRGWQSLETELRKILPEGEVGKRLVDKLMQVHRLDGRQQEILVHLEIQAKPEPGFDERMFVYNYRSYDVRRRPVVSLAILADDRPSWRPGSFGWDLWGCRMGIRFPVVKLCDYNERWPHLEASANPFAMVVMAHLESRSTRRDPAGRYAGKLRLMRRLAQAGLDRGKVEAVLRFIDWVMTLPRELEARFRDEVRKLQGELSMPYVTSFERLAKQEGLEEGRKEGLEEGRQEGLRQGVREGEASLLRLLLSRRFGELPRWAGERLEGAGQDELERWGERILDAASLEDVFAAV